jgi:chromosome segregation ATPase
MTANELADKLLGSLTMEYDCDKYMEQAATMLRQQQAEIEELETGLKNVWKVVEGKQTEIDRLNYDMEGFKQNFFVSGFHLQIKMANEQLLKQQEQIDALKSELDRAVELYTDKAIKVEQLEKELTEAGHMIGVLREYISDLENGLDSSIKLNKAQAERQVKELTDVEIMSEWEESKDEVDFARAILRKAQEK